MTTQIECIARTDLCDKIMMLIMKKHFVKRGRKPNLIIPIEKIARLSAGSRLSLSFRRSVEAECNTLCRYLDCTPMEAILFSIVFNLNLSNSSVELERIAKWLDCMTITVARHINHLEELRKKKILRRVIAENNEEGEASLKITNLSYAVCPFVYESITRGTRYSPPDDEIKDTYDLIRSISRLVRQRENNLITFDEMWHEIRRIQSECSGMDFLKTIRRFPLDEQERLLFFSLCDEYLQGRAFSDLASIVQLVTPYGRDQLNLRHSVITGISPLVVQGLVQLEEGFFKNDRDIGLTTKAIEILLKDHPELIIGNRGKTSSDLVRASGIRNKNLFFNPEEQEHLESLGKILTESNYRKMVRRLDQEGMKTGIAILFYGPPGTGKTESVYQLARLTGRDIQQVTISETKSKWYGESEKLIKKIFDKYRKLAGQSELAPILFLNEADAIISKRKTIHGSSVDQTENAIQNILLQELEDMKGVLIATTNMTSNFDTAFDRRFLYKIHFRQPSEEVKRRIWEDKLPKIPRETADDLARSFDLSGGQIDNIARKCMTNFILYGKTVSYSQVTAWCREEMSGTMTRKIGY